MIPETERLILRPWSKRTRKNDIAAQRIPASGYFKEAERGRGYGGEALNQVLAYIRTKPFGDSNRVALNCNKDNQIARNLYETKGFTAIGVEDKDEIELAVIAEKQTPL